MKIETNKFVMPSLDIVLTVAGRDGGIIRCHREPGHSWTRNAWNMQMAAMAGICGDAASSFGAGYMSTRNTVATISATAGSSIDTVSNTVPTTSGWDNNAVTADFGIQVGTGDTAFSVNDYVLAALIAHGTGSGQMLYANQLAPVQAYTSGTKTWSVTHKRNIINDSGASITVKEIGLVWRGSIFSGSTTTNRLMARDVLGSAVTVADTELLTVEYVISMDYSTID